METDQLKHRWEEIIALLREYRAKGHDYPDPLGKLEESVQTDERIEAERELRERFMQQAFAAERPIKGIALDAGCGLGAYSSTLQQEFCWVLSLDADSRRLAIAQQHTPPVDHHHFFTLPLEEPLLLHRSCKDAFSLIHCLQVFGHTAGSVTMTILRSFHHMLHPKGWLLLALPYNNTDDDTFKVCCFDKQQQPQGKPITLEQFDQLSRNPQPGKLPVRHFSMLSLQWTLQQTGWHIKKHYPYNWQSYTEADLLVLAQKIPHTQ